MIKNNKKNSKKHSTTSLKLTSEGGAWFVLSFLIFLIATNYNNNVVFLLACLLLGVWLLSAWLTLKNMVGLNCLHWSVDPCFEGSDAVYRLLVEAHDGQSHFEIGCDEANETHRVTELNKGKRHWLLFNTKMDVRGNHKPSDTSVFSTWPFGLWQASCTTPDIPLCLVYPKPMGNQPLPSLDQRCLDIHSTDELSGLRSYQEGDNLRYIDWKAMARSEQTLVKIFDGDHQQQTLWLDAKNVQVVDFEDKCRQLSRWVVECERQGIQYGLRVGAAMLSPGSTRIHQHLSLRLLALARE